MAYDIQFRRLASQSGRGVSWERLVLCVVMVVVVLEGLVGGGRGLVGFVGFVKLHLLLNLKALDGSV